MKIIIEVDAQLRRLIVCREDCAFSLISISLLAGSEFEFLKYIPKLFSVVCRSGGKEEEVVRCTWFDR